MKLKSRVFIGFSTAVLIITSAVNVRSDQQWFGGPEDVSFAEDLWQAMVEAKVVGVDAVKNEPYIGLHPHGAILETSIDTLTVNGVANALIAKRSYRGINVSVESVESDRAAFLEDITIMFKREAGYDSANQDWFWAKYDADGSLSETPNAVKLAGRIAKGKSKGCIACHRKAGGGDFLFIN